MMSNPRRRRTVIAVVSLLFILVIQIPNILNALSPDDRSSKQEPRKGFVALERERAAGRITKEEYDRQHKANQAAWEAARKSESEKNYETTWRVNQVAPPGWLPYGAATVVQGRTLPALACIAGMGLIGVVSLRRSYRTTIRLYMGDFNAGRTRREARIRAVSKDPSNPVARIRSEAAFLEKKLPWISEHASAITLMCFRSMMRATEVKTMLLTSVVMLVIFGGMLAGRGGTVPVLGRPLVALGSIAFILILGMTGLVGNQFAFDRDGFRAFVLSCAPRRDILLGKNLSLLPLALMLMVFIVGLFTWKNPMRLDHVAAVLLQTIPMYLIFCLAGNTLSILSPVALRAGSGQPAPHQGLRVLYQIVYMIVMPVLFGLTLIPFAIEALFGLMQWAAWFPAFLVLGAVQVAAMLWIYRMALNWQGRLLQRHEQRILEVVSSKAE